MRYETSSSNVCAAFSIKLLHDARAPKHVVRKINGKRSYVRPLKKEQYIVYESMPDGLSVFWIGWKPVLVKVDMEDGDYLKSISLTFLKGTVDHKQFLEDAMKYFNKLNELDDEKDKSYVNFYIERFHGKAGIVMESEGKSGRGGADVWNDEDGTASIVDLYSTKPLHWDRSDLGQPIIENALSTMYLNDGAIEALDEARKWLKSEQWYKSKQIPWKRGWLMHGVPGTGKTSYIKNLAMEMNIPIMIFDLATMKNEDFSKAWTSIKTRSPCIALFEDFDNVFHGRENQTKIESGSLTFDCLLNGIDGIENSEGIFTIITTNNIDVIDSAIAKKEGEEYTPSRPGRIDRVFEMTPPSEEGLRIIATRILSDFPDQIEPIVKAGKGETGSQFQERCSRLSLGLHWEAKHEVD